MIFEDGLALIYWDGKKYRWAQWYLQRTGCKVGGETGLDYFGARYYSGAQGRFTSPDPIYFQSEMLLDPQHWNLFAYVGNILWLLWIPRDGH